MDLRVDLLLGGVRTHSENAILALKPNLHTGWEVLGDQSGHTNTKIDVETTVMTDIVRYSIGGCDEPEKKTYPSWISLAARFAILWRRSWEGSPGLEADSAVGASFRTSIAFSWVAE